MNMKDATQRTKQSANNKKLIVYCSILSIKEPPSMWFDSAVKMSESVPLIFIELAMPKSKQRWWESYSFMKWVAQIMLRPTRFTHWNLEAPFSKIFLFGYLLHAKYLLKTEIELLTNYPQYSEIYKYIPYDKCFFDCVDEYSPGEIENNQKFIRQCDMVFTNSRLLFTKIKSITSKVVQISSGYYFSTKKLKLINQKICHSVVFYGGISHRIDYVFLSKVIDLLPGYHFFFIGEIYLNKFYVDSNKDDLCLRRWTTLCRQKNVHYLGKIEHQHYLDFLKLFEVGIIPYDCTDYMNYNSHPQKCYDYLSSGLSVVSTPIPSIQERVGAVPIFTASSPVEFAQKIVDISKSQNKLSFNHSVSSLLNSQSIELKIKQLLEYI